MPTNAYLKLTEQGWTVAQRHDGTTVPLIDLADTITAAQSATWDEVQLTSTEDQHHTSTEKPEGVLYYQHRSDGITSTYSWTVRAYTLPARLHLGYAGRDQVIGTARNLTRDQDGTRSSYVNACTLMRKQALTDEELTAYGMTYGDYSPAQDPDGTLVAAQILSGPRRRALKKEQEDARFAAAMASRASREQAVQDAEAAGRVCAGCGVGVPAGTGMIASLGLSCTDCYDDLAD